MKATANDLLGRLATAARPRRPWLRLTVPPWIARTLLAAGAQPERPGEVPSRSYINDRSNNFADAEDLPSPPASSLRATPQRSIVRTNRLRYTTARDHIVDQPPEESVPSGARIDASDDYTVDAELLRVSAWVAAGAAISTATAIALVLYVVVGTRMTVLFGVFTVVIVIYRMVLYPIKIARLGAMHMTKPKTYHDADPVEDQPASVQGEDPEQPDDEAPRSAS
jgi:hypothetical protein